MALLPVVLPSDAAGARHFAGDHRPEPAQALAVWRDRRSGVVTPHARRQGARSGGTRSSSTGFRVVRVPGVHHAGHGLAGTLEQLSFRADRPASAAQAADRPLCLPAKPTAEISRCPPLQRLVLPRRLRFAKHPNHLQPGFYQHLFFRADSRWNLYHHAEARLGINDPLRGHRASRSVGHLPFFRSYPAAIGVDSGKRERGPDAGPGRIEFDQSRPCVRRRGSGCQPIPGS